MINSSGIEDANVIERLELEHSERQEILRDINNKVAREEVDTLEKYGGFI
jgi:hypothetical protein